MRVCTLQLSDALGTNRLEETRAQTHSKHANTALLHLQTNTFTYHKVIRAPARLSERKLNVNVLFVARLII
jgi:hypothetical protein